MPPALVADPELVTTAWLTEVLRDDGAIGVDSAVTSFSATPIGTGQVGANVRYELSYGGPAGPASVVCKFASRDPDSAAAGIATLTYETEVAFYRQLADTVAISRPHCFHAAIEPGTANVVLVLEDLSPAEQGDQIQGCSVDQAAMAIDEAARLHGPRWGDPTLARLAWLQRSSSEALWDLFPDLWRGFVGRYERDLDPVTGDEGSRLVASLSSLRANQPRVPTVVHNDYRLDNMLFGPPGSERRITVVDWQTVRLGRGPHDVAYFLGSAFAAAEVRRSCEEDLVRRYHDALRGCGVSGYGAEECWDDYRRSSYACLVMAVFASMLVGRTERGDRMFLAMANRSARMGADLEAFDLLERG